MDREQNKTINQDWQKRFNIKAVTAEEAVRKILPGHRVFIGTGAAQPSMLINAMTDRADELVDVEIIQLVTMGDPPYTKKELSGSFKVNSFYISEESIRASISEGLGTYTPIMLSDIPQLFKNGQIPLDVSMIQVSPPDERGMCSMGISVDVAKSAVESSKIVIAQVNPRMPRTLGDSLINIYELDLLVQGDEPLLEIAKMEINNDEERVCEFVSSLIDDGCTIQLGFGKIPQFCMDYLKDKKDLGIHSDIITEKIVDLVRSGAVTGKRKTINQGKIVVSFCLGTKELYDFINNNEMFAFRRTEYVNDPMTIRQHDKMVAVNTALEIDLTGQVCSDSFGTQFISGIGGQADFIRGANKSFRGTSIIPLLSTAKQGTASRIVAQLTPGAGVVTPRGDVHYIVTEYGIAYLHGKNVQDRTMALISIAHPDFRAELLKKAIEYGYVVPELAKIEGKLVLSPSSVLTTTMYLDDGTKIKFRPIHPTDTSRMRNLFHKLTSAAVDYRFGWDMNQMPQKQIQDFVYIDHRKEIGIVGTIPNPARTEEEIIAFAGYYLNDKTNRSEVALVVQDEWQNRGIGSFMIKYLSRIAKKDGIRGFTAGVQSTNKKMQAVMQKLDGKVESVQGGNVFSMRTDFS
jgi:acyl-CoA hydrolase/GNAT superfamily N-acetyltransferase